MDGLNDDVVGGVDGGMVKQLMSAAHMLRQSTERLDWLTPCV